MVRISTVYDIATPLSRIPREEWDDYVIKKGHRIAEMLNFRLDEAIDILDDIEANGAWAAAGMSREGYLKCVCQIEPDGLNLIRQGVEAIKEGRRRRGVC
ncbi:MAG TPA: hypothetical protein VK196_06150 [Magnetospirillum sp.]|nr:hypothetical protein [Magnetospirillum sp.]